MKIFLTAGFVSVLAMAAATEAPAQARHQGKSIVDVIPAGFITEPFQVPLFTRDQLFSREPELADDVRAIQQVWSAYVFYHDTYDGEGEASLFAPDGIWDETYNDNGVLRPVGGVEGKGCFVKGRRQLAMMINLQTNNAPPMGLPGDLKHKVTDPLVKVQGDRAVLTAQWHLLKYDRSTNETAVRNGGSYMIQFRKYPKEGWMVQADHIIYDYLARPFPSKPKVVLCDRNGILPEFLKAKD